MFNFDNSYEKLPSIFYRKVHLNPVSKPSLLYLNKKLAEELGLDIEKLEEKCLGVFSGSEFPENASQISQAYMGDQYGNLTMLGDGRAVLVGEILNPDNKRYDIQLKGSGRSPFSRGGDGKATLGPMLKEYIFSEALQGLKVPTSRSLAVVLSGENVIRERLYKGAILTRVASSHIRVGTFQYASYMGEFEDLKALADYTINRHYPSVKEDENQYLGLYREVVKTQAKTIAKWMSVSFVHGVMNTDNMTVSGETIDYGPCAFIDKYDLTSVYSSIDRYGRYAFGNQPNVAMWNLGRFGESLIPIIADDKEESIKLLNSILVKFKDYFQDEYYFLMRKKLGIIEGNKKDNPLVDEFLKFLENNKLDFTNAFLDLTFKNFNNENYSKEDFLSWKEKWEVRIKSQGKSDEEIINFMKAINPSIIPRNYWIRRSIEEAEDLKFDLFNEFFEALQNPFAYSEIQEKFKEVPENLNYVTYCGT